MKSRIIGKKTIPSRRLCQILILANAEENVLFLPYRSLKKIKSWLYMANYTGQRLRCSPHTQAGVKTNFLQVHHI